MTDEKVQRMRLVGKPAELYHVAWGPNLLLRIHGSEAHNQMHRSGKG